MVAIACNRRRLTVTDHLLMPLMPHRLLTALLMRTRTMSALILRSRLPCGSSQRGTDSER